jgi:hypothetical protein
MKSFADVSKTREDESRNHDTQVDATNRPGPERLVFVVGVVEAATFDETNQDIVSLVFI